MMGPAGRLRLPVRERDLRVPQATFRVDEAVTAAEVDTPISSREVRLIASQGFPLWEPVPVMVLRNRRITIAYADLSRRLADAIAGDGSARQANWCTYATWSSRTIGNWIDPEARQAPIPDRPGWGDSLERTLRPLTEWLVARDNGATYRSLAAGNRYVFLEIGLAVACFLEHVEHAGQGVRHEATWSRYWDHMASVLD
ncbi:MAG TPA: hypothetical protein VFI47_13610, partial [Acidimicrobiales bacterium]|nr:hypothetical protein [Acidimicrobiales bacterium]